MSDTGWSPNLPDIPDRYGVVFPDGALFDVTESARLFDQDAGVRAVMMADKVAGQAVRIKTTLERL